MAGSPPYGQKVTQVTANVLAVGSANARVTQATVNALVVGNSNTKVTQIIAMALVRNAALVAIDVEPAHAIQKTGTTVQYQAIGVHSDGGRVPIPSSQITWSADYGTIIDANGLAQVSYVGDSNIKATLK